MAVTQGPAVPTAHPASSAPELPGVFEPERLTPLADGFIRDGDAPLGEQIFYIAEAQAEAVIEPDGVADDWWKAVSAVARVIGLVCQPCINLTVPGRKAVLEWPVPKRVLLPRTVIVGVDTHTHVHVAVAMKKAADVLNLSERMRQILVIPDAGGQGRDRHRR